MQNASLRRLFLSSQQTVNAYKMEMEIWKIHHGIANNFQLCSHPISWCQKRTYCLLFYFINAQKLGCQKQQQVCVWRKGKTKVFFGAYPQEKHPWHFTLKNRSKMPHLRSLPVPSFLFWRKLVLFLISNLPTLPTVPSLKSFATTFAPH